LHICLGKFMWPWHASSLRRTGSRALKLPKCHGPETNHHHQFLLLDVMSYDKEEQHAGWERVHQEESIIPCVSWVRNIHFHMSMFLELLKSNLS
jgi:hypothetical protein